MTRTLIGLGGRLRAGKDALGDYLVENKNFVKLGMSDALNEALQRIGTEGPWVRLDFDIIIDKPWTRGLRRGKLGKGEYVRYRDLLAAVGYVEAKRHRDVRDYLQGLGTEVGRDMIDPDVWIRIAEARIREHWDNGRDVVITAIRFPNELEMIRRLDGASVWIERATRLTGPLKHTLHSHVSETSVHAGMFDWRITNDGTLDELYAEADRLFDR